MKKQLLSAPLLAFLTLALVAGADAADRTWTAGGSDNNWTTAGNWAGSIIPATTDGVVFANAGLGGTNIVNQNWQVSSLSYSNSSPTQGHFTDLAGYTLVITNFLRTGYNASNCMAIISNGVLQLGTSNRAVSLVIGYNGVFSPPSVSNILLKIYGTVNATNLSAIEISDTPNAANSGLHSNNCVALLDLSEAVINSPLGANTLKAGILRVGGFYSTGTLKLPPALTTLEVDKFLIPRDVSNGGNQYGTLDFGTNSQLRTLRVLGDFRLGYNGSGFLVGWPTNVDVFIGSSTNLAVMSIAEQQGYLQGMKGTFTMTNGSLTAYLRELSVGKSGTAHRPVGVLDLSATRVQIGDEINKIKVGYLTVCGADTIISGAADAYGTLKLPPEITDIIVTTLQLGRGYNWTCTSQAILDLGANSGLTNLVVSNAFYLADGTSTLLYGLPTNKWNLSIGTPAKPASWRVASRAYAHSSVVFSPTNCVLKAYLSEFLVAGNSVDHTWPGPSATVDLRRVTVTALVVTGNVTIAADTVSYANYTLGNLYLPACDATCDKLYVGNALTNPAASSVGLLDLSGTRLTVTNFIRIDRAGIVSNHVMGASSGLDLLSENTNDFQIVGTNRGLRVNFEADPNLGLTEKYYWGLRMAGDKTAYIQSLVDGNWIRVSKAGLSAKYSGQVGVFYHAGNNKTFIGIMLSDQGSVFLIR